MTAGADTTELNEQANPAAPGAGHVPDPPRPLTPRVRRRAWTEPHVRSWWVLTLALLLIGSYICAREWLIWSREVRLIQSGRVVDAEITMAGGLRSRWQQLPPESLVTIRYTIDGKTYDKSGYLKGRKDYIQVRSKVPVRVDPADPDQWTARTQPPALAQQLTGAAVVGAAFAVMAVVSLWRRAAVARVWRDGTLARAIVVDSRQTALAPRSRLVRCTPADTGDNRVVQAYFPAGAAANLQPGDETWLLFPPGGRGKPVAAAWFE